MKQAPFYVHYRAKKRCFPLNCVESYKRYHLIYAWYLCVCAQSCLTICNPMFCRLSGSSVHGIFQARILEWVAISFSPGIFPHTGIESVSPASPALASGFFTSAPSGNHILAIYTWPDKIARRDFTSELKKMYVNNQSVHYSKQSVHR